ncbi:MAG: PorV/PorQ family protein [bacterium]|jgi:hypothetical protein
MVRSDTYRGVKALPAAALVMAAAIAALGVNLLMPAAAVSQTSLGDQRVGTSSGSFLRVGVGARPVGMGGAYVAVCNDAVSCAWNPAGLIHIDGYEFALTHTELPADIVYNHACYGMPIKRLDGTIAVQFGVLTTDLMETTEYHPYGTGRKFGFTDWLFGLTVAKRFTDRFSGGFAVKYVREELGVEVGGPTTGALVLDAGTYYEIGPRNMRLAVALMNFGGDMTPDGTYDTETDNGISQSTYAGFAPATEFKFGIALEPVARPWLDTVVDFELAHPSDNKESFRLGGEALFSKVLAVRAGYDFGADAMKTSFGLGANVTILEVKSKIDYSATLTEYLSTVHRLTITLGRP